MAEAVVSTKFQVVIPKEIRREIGLESGQVFQVIAKGGVITMVPDQPIARMTGRRKRGEVRVLPRDGRERTRPTVRYELFYLTGGKTMTAVSVKSQGRISLSDRLSLSSRLPIQMLVDTLFGPSKYDLAADDQFLIAVRASEESPPPLVLVLNGPSY